MTSTLALILATLAIVAAVLWYARRAGVDKQRAASAEETLDDITDANRAVTDAERDKLRKKYRRD